MSRIVDIAREWRGTPYRHQGRLKGVGCDCIGLILGVAKEAGFEGFSEPESYTPDWAETGKNERLILGLSAHLKPVEICDLSAGDIVVFRMRPNAVAKHAAILASGGVDDRHAKIIHAYWGHAVVESWLHPFWRKHLVAGFRFGPLSTSPLSRGEDGPKDQVRVEAKKETPHPALRATFSPQAGRSEKGTSWHR